MQNLHYAYTTSTDQHTNQNTVPLSYVVTRYLLGKITCTIRCVDDLVEEHRVVQCKSKPYRICRRHLFFCNIECLLIGILRLINHIWNNVHNQSLQNSARITNHWSLYSDVNLLEFMAHMGHWRCIVFLLHSTRSDAKWTADGSVKQASHRNDKRFAPWHAIWRTDDRKTRDSARGGVWRCGSGEVGLPRGDKNFESVQKFLPRSHDLSRLHCEVHMCDFGCHTFRE